MSYGSRENWFTDGQTDGRTDGHGDNISVFFPMRKKALIIVMNLVFNNCYKILHKIVKRNVRVTSNFASVEEKVHSSHVQRVVTMKAKKS